MAESLIEARGLQVARSGRSVIEGLDLDAHRGRILSILGPNGAGKSTLLRALAGLLPYTGRIAHAGDEIRDIEPRDRARSIAFVPQRSQLAVDLPVRAVVGHGRYAHRGGLSRLSDTDRSRIDAALDTTRVTHLASRPYARLSYGEQRRVLLARALATGADTLLLDEPTASLDISHALSLHATLRRLSTDGHCIIIVLHQLDDALRFTDEALLLDRGRRVASGAVAEVVCPEHIEPIYGVKLTRGTGIEFHLAPEEPEAPA